MTNVRVSEISDRKLFIDNWRTNAADQNLKPFCDLPWVSSLFATANEEATIFAIEAMNGGEYSPVAFAGMQKPKSFLHNDKLIFMESGEELLDRIYPEYLDIGNDKNRAAVVNELFESFKAVGEFQFRNCTSALKKTLIEISNNIGLKAQIFREQPTFKIDLEKVRGEAEYVSLVSKSLREKIRRSKRIYEERGALSLSFATTETERMKAFENLKRLHENVWSGRGETGAFSQEEVCRFHETLIAEWPVSVDFLSLSVGSDVVGVLYNFRRGGYVCNYQSGFLMEQDNRLAPGFVLHAMAADHYAKSGCDIYDFLAGDAEYKRRLGEPGETLFSVSVSRPGLRSSLRLALSQGKALLDGRSKRHLP